MTLWSHGFVRSCDKSQIYIHYHNAYGHLTWHSYDLLWEAFTNKVTSSFDDVILRDNVTNEKHYISTIIMSLTTKRGRMVKCSEELPPMTSHNNLILWSFEVMWKVKHVLSPLVVDQCPPNLAGWYHNIYDKQTCQSCNLEWAVNSSKVT